MIDDNATVSDGYRCLVNSIPLEHQIGHTELCELYQYGDYLVTRTNKRIEMYTELLKYIPRYKLMADNGFLRRGLVVDKLPDAHQNLYKLMHGMTIHATQGTTVYPPRKLFICMDQEMEMRVLYTALSRVRSFDQVYLVSTYHEPDFKRRFLSPTERLTTQGPDAYDTVGPEPDMDWNAPDDDVLDSFF